MDSRTLRGVTQVGGWFLRADAGLRMVPGTVREMGNTYEADLLVLRPGAPSQHLDATFRVEAGLITSSATSRRARRGGSFVGSARRVTHPTTPPPSGPTAPARARARAIPRGAASRAGSCSHPAG